MPGRIAVQSAIGQQQADIDRSPDFCPVCGRAISPIDFGIAWASATWLAKVYRCPWDECSHLFVAEYKRTQLQPGGVGMYLLSRCFPKTPQIPPFSGTIRDISSDFCEIYSEANAAEQFGLKLIPGPGYRKALEFLIKDYLCRIHPDQAEKIQRSQLGNCIKEFVKSEKIVAVSSRAAWLGNDETHYVRKWVDKDLQDLKKLINLTVLWIEMEETTQQLLTDMPDPAQPTR